MPTHEETAQFWRDGRRLSVGEKADFKAALKRFVEDLENLPSGRFRPGLSVKPMQGAPGIFEMTWDRADGRATFQYGSELREGDPHIIWRRIGGHEVFANP